MRAVQQRTAGSDVRGLLRHLAAQPVERRRAAIAMLDQRGAEFNVHPLSSAQLRMWLASQLYSDVALYNVSLGFRLTGHLDVGALSRALQALVARHEMLRTVFFDVDGKPYQAILPDLPITLQVGRLPGSGEEREAFAAHVLEAEARRPMKLLKRGSLIRAILLTTGEEGDHLFSLTMHHIVCDGWSTATFFRELGEAYSAILDGRPPALPRLPIRYVDYARRQAARMRTPAFGEDLRYWVEQLGGAPPLLQLPADHPRPARQSFRGGTEMTLWPQELRPALEAFCRRENVTVFVALMAAFAAMVHRWTGREDIPIGSPFANRNQPDIEHVIGFFVNTLVLRVRLAASMTFRELLRRVREVVFTAQGYQDLPFEVLVDALKPDRSANHHPLFQVIFTMQDPNAIALKLRGVESQVMVGHNDTSKFDLTFSVMLTDAGPRAIIEYDADQFEPDRMRRMFADMHATVMAAMTDPEVPLSALPAGG
jgi:Condensation domain